VGCTKIDSDFCVGEAEIEVDGLNSFITFNEITNEFSVSSPNLADDYEIEVTCTFGDATDTSDQTITILPVNDPPEL